MLGMNATCACPFLTQHGPLFCPPERRGPRNVERRQDLRPMHDSRDLDAKKRGLPGKIRALCIRNRPIAPRNGYMGRRSCQLQREKHAFRANAAREAPFFVQSAKREYMARESCHSSQSNLEDRHNESIGRQNANPKKDPGTTAKSPNTKATPTRPLFWQPEATLKSTCHQDDSRKGTNPRSMKQLARQLSTKDPWRKAACASSFDAHRCRHRRS